MRFISRTGHSLEHVIAHRMKRCLVCIQTFITIGHLDLSRKRTLDPTHGVTSSTVAPRSDICCGLCDVLGCKLYFLDERTRKFVPDIRVNKQVLYRDRHTIEYTPTDHDRDVDASIEEGVVDTEDVDSIMEDAKSIVIVLTDAQDADVPDSIWAVPVQKIVVHPTLSTSI